MTSERDRHDYTSAELTETRNELIAARRLIAKLEAVIDERWGIPKLRLVEAPAAGEVEIPWWMQEKIG